MCVDASLRSLDPFLQPTSHTCASRGKRDPIGTADHRTGGLVRLGNCLIVLLLGFLEHLLGLLNLHLAGLHINIRQDSALASSGFQEILLH